MTAPRIAAVILAAGQSRRMGDQNKLLLPYRGQPLIAHCVAQARDLSDIIVVTGHQAEKVRQAVSCKRARFVHNAGYEDGMSGSLKAGLAAVAPDYDAMLVMLGDMPDISREILSSIIAAYAPDQGRDIIIPVHQGRRGNPVLWGRAFFAAFEDITGDQGAKSLLTTYGPHVHEVESHSPAIFRDVDSPAAYRALTLPSD